MIYIAFSHDVTSAIGGAKQRKEAMLMCYTHPVGVKLFSCKKFLCSKKVTWLLITRVKILWKLLHDALGPLRIPKK